MNALRYGFLLSAMVGSSVASAATLIDLGFDENTGTTVANAGTLGGSATLEASGGPPRTVPAWTSGVLGTGVSFPNQQQAAASHYSRVKMPVGTSLDNLSNFTLTFWINQTYINDGHEHAVFSNNDGSDGLLVTTSATNGQIFVKYGGQTNYLAGGEYASGVWSFVALAFNGTGLTHYTGSESAAASTFATTSYTASSMGTATADVYLGSYHGSWANTWDLGGKLDEVQFHDTTLTLAQVEAVRQSTVPEPASLGILALLGMVLARRGRVS